MTGLPSHPETDRPGADDAPEPSIGATSRRRRVLGIAVGVALVVVFIVLHLTGVVGAESH